MKSVLLLAITIMSFNASAIFCEGTINHNDPNIPYDFDAWADFTNPLETGSKIEVYDGNDFEVSIDFVVDKISLEDDMTYVNAIGEDNLELSFYIDNQSEQGALRKFKIVYTNEPHYLLYAQGDLICR